MSELSIVVPVYNVEKYISQCVDSIIAQTFTDWELILVDDGSRDSSSMICDGYSSQDERIRVIHTENGGVSSARNKGIDAAKGRWITFIDSDDFISPSFLEGLLKPALEHGSLDFVQGGCTNWADGKAIDVNQQYDDYVGCDLSMLYDCFRGLAVSKLFKLDNLNSRPDGHALRFDETMNLAEDMLFSLKYFATVSSYALSSEVGYFYRRDNISSLTSKPSGRTYEMSLYAWKQIYSSFIDTCKLHDIDPLSLMNRRSVLGGTISSVLDMLYSSGYPRSRRLRVLKEDFSYEELKYLNFAKNINKLGRFVNMLLLKEHCIYYDTIKNIFHIVL